MAGIGQYLKDTRSELRHVAWPTRMQTIVYTALVALISIGIALYLGLFDYVFTTAITKIVIPNAAPATTQQAATTTEATSTSATSTVNFGL